MRTILLTLSLLAIIFTGCKKSSPGYTIKATINGRSFNAPVCYGLVNDSILTITETPGTFIPGYPYLGLIVSNYRGAGTYSIKNAFIDSNNSNNISAAYGSVVITATSPNIIGTFSFTCTDATQVTNGSFVAGAGSDVQ